MKLITDNGETIEIESVQVLELQPNDLIVLKSERHLSVEEHNHIRHAMKGKIPNHNIILLEGGMDVVVLRGDYPDLTGAELAAHLRKLATETPGVSG